jgi:WD40 repeat protein
LIIPQLCLLIVCLLFLALFSSTQQIGELEDNSVVVFKSNYCTDVSENKSSLCSYLTVGVIENTNLVCGAFDDNCIVYSVRHNSKPTEEKSDPLLFTMVTQFKADFSDDCPTVNCSTFCDGTDKVITGGQDGVVRVWRLMSKKGVWSAKCVNELKGHTGPIMSVRVHSQNAAKWVCSASRDGSVRLWDHSVGGEGTFAAPKPANPALTPPKEKEKSPLLATLVGKESLQEYIAGHAEEAKASGLAVAASVTHECRGVEFSANGHELFMLLCPRKGCAVIIRYLLEVAATKTDKAAGGPRFVVQPRVLGVLNVAKVPCTKMRASADGSLLAAGCSDGSTVVVKVFTEPGDGTGEARVVSMRVISRTTELHDLPVTGLGFVRSSLEGAADLVVSCSADNKSITSTLGGGGGDMSTLMLLAVVALMVALVLYYLQEQGLVTLPEF